MGKEKTMMEALDNLTYPTDEDETHARVMRELQEEWEVNRNHVEQRYTERPGIRSSQISALIMYLIKKGVLK